MLRHVKGARLVGVAVAAAVLPLLAAACGDDASSDGTLPPMITTTTTTTLYLTTTTVITYYNVQPGDTLSKIASRFSVTVQDLMAVNGITDPDHIEAGQRLKIPPAVQVVDTLPPAATTTAPVTTVSP